MYGKLSLIILLLLALLLGGYLVSDAPNRVTSNGNAARERLFPGLEQQLNDITRIRITQAGESYQVVRNAGQWRLTEKSDYPVEFEPVKQLLLGLAQLEKFEPKTVKAENYARLGVEDPGPDTPNTLIELYHADKRVLVSVIVGKTRSGLIAGGRDGIYVRLSGDTRAWLAAGSLALPGNPVGWLDTGILHVKPKWVKRVTIRHPDGVGPVLEKAHKGLADFRIANLPPGAVLRQDAAINTLAQSLAGLQMEDVMRRESTRIDRAQAVVSEFETWDGVRVTVYSKENADQKVIAWIDVRAAQVNTADLAAFKSPELDIASLQSQLADWAFVLPDARAAKLRTRLDQLIEEGR